MTRVKGGGVGKTGKRGKGKHQELKKTKLERKGEEFSDAEEMPVQFREEEARKGREKPKTQESRGKGVGFLASRVDEERKIRGPLILVGTKRKGSQERERKKKWGGCRSWCHLRRGNTHKRGGLGEKMLGKGIEHLQVRTKWGGRGKKAKRGLNETPAQ